MKRTFSLAAAALNMALTMALAAGCQKEDVAGAGNSPGNGDATTTVHFEIQKPEPESRARSIVQTDENAVNDINIFIYDQGLLAGDIYMKDSSNAEVELASGKTYTFYTLANAGNQTAPAEEKDIAGYRHKSAGVGDFALLGIPMASTDRYAVSGKETTVKISLERLSSRINFRIDTEAIPGFRVTSVMLHNCPADVAPFALSSAAQAVSSGDMASTDDIKALNSGGTVHFYTLENCQGVLLPDNGDPWQKIPENIPEEKAELCTYMEVYAILDGTSGLEGNVIYRFYLGQDTTSDFNVIRNTSSTVTLVTTEEGLDKVSWKIDNGNLTPISVPVIIAASGGNIFYTNTSGNLIRVSLGSDSWNCVTGSGNTYVAAGNNGALAYSSDGKNWKMTRAGSEDWNAITYGNGRFVAAGSGGTIGYSTDGKSWHVYTTGQQTWKSIAYGKYKFVAVGNDGNYAGATAYSSNGKNWTVKSGKTYQNIEHSIAYGNSRFVAVGKRGRYAGTSGYSTDGINWIMDSGTGSVEHRCISFGDGIFMTTGKNETLTSEDGISWEYAEPYPFSATANGMDFGSGFFAAAGNQSSGDACVFFTVNGSKWINATEEPPGDYTLNGVHILE